MPEVSDIATPDSGAAAAPRPLGGFAAPAWWPWGVGVLVGLLVVGPGLGGGSLLSLDLLVTPEMAVPPGVYGLGPALSQRVPLFVLVGWLAALVGGPVAVKVLLVGWVAVGFAGAARLVRVLEPRAGALAQATAGLLWAAGPFALTRIGVGHINLVWVVAVLPWELFHVRTAGIDLFSTHLAPAPEHGRHRLVQVAEIDRVIKATRGDRDVHRFGERREGLPPILCGDFNAEADSDEIRFLCGLTTLNDTTTFYQDAWRVAGDGPGYTNDWKRNPFCAGLNVHRKRIDYVFVGDPFLRAGDAGRVLDVRLVADEPITGIVASDHFGVMATIVWPDRPAAPAE